VRRETVSRERLLPSGRSVMAVTEHNVWIEEKAAGVTPMCGALGEGLSLVEWWCRGRRNAASYPPTVINITDGEASDGDADRVRDIAAKIRATGTTDGNTILMNIHLARRDEPTEAVLFPSSPDLLPDHRYARLLWDISSEMPDSRGRAVGWGSHIGHVAAMMNIGSVNSLMI
jgi:hypothetical protein